MKIKILLILALCMAASTNANAKEYTFGIVPQQSSKKLARLWTPVIKKLSQDTGLKIKFATAKDIPTFEKRLSEGEYDFAYMNPYHFTVYNKAPGYLAMAHQSDKRIRGIIVVHKDSEITTLSELDGAMMAFPSPAAFAATILPTANLNKMDIEVDSKYVSSHDSVYLTVSRGLLVAGGGIVRTLENTDPAIRDSLRVLWKSEGYTPHAFAAHPSISPINREKVAKALASLNETENGTALLAALKFQAIQLADDSSWNDVKSLNITSLDLEN